MSGSEPPENDRMEEIVFRGFELEPEEMRRLGYAVIDRLVERWVGLPDDVAWAGASRADLEPLLMEPAPEEGRDLEEVLERALSRVLPVAGRIDHPRFFAFVPSSPTWPGILADFLAKGHNVFQGTWLESAGPSEVELVVLEWFRRWLGMPEGAGGLLTSGGSAANLVGLVAAREWAGNPDGPVVYVSDQGHSSLERAARIAGVPRENVRSVPTGRDMKMRADAAEALVAEDRARGLSPVCLCASAGTTNTGTVDPLDELADLCRREKLWFHVDGAYGAFAALLPGLRDEFRGMERADSVTLDPHKWLFQPYETGCLMARRPADLEAAFRVLPEYLQDTEVELDEVNFADRGLQLTRSFRALRIWVSVQAFGMGRFREAIAHGVELTRRAEERIRSSRWLELLTPASLGVVCYRFRPPGAEWEGDGSEPEELDRLNAAVNERVVRSGYAMISSTRIRGRYALRLCVLNHRSRMSDVLGTLERVEDVGRELLKS